MNFYLSAENLSKTYRTIAGSLVTALSNFSFSLGRGEFVTIIGPSGSGKSTLIKVLAGIEQPTSGEVHFNENVKPRIGFVFQSNTVFPWWTVEDNLSYSLRIKRVPSEKRHHEAVRIAQLMGLDPYIYLKKFPKELSGGEVRRVAIGMALAHEANLLLMDEPTSQLDHFTKLKMQDTVQKIWQIQRITIMYVTHDIDEAIFLGDRVLMMARGAMKSILLVDLKRPRTPEVIGSDVFATYRLQILNAYESEMNQTTR